MLLDQVSLSKLFSVGVAGDRRSQMSWYVAGPQTARRVECFLSALEMPWQ